MKGLELSGPASEWGTPQALFDGLDMEFRFTLDVCARQNNAKCQRYFDPGINGLAQPWTGIVWMNPPYGRALGSWVRKAFKENQDRGTLVVALLPATTDVAWFHDYVYGKAEIRFIRGRLKYSDKPGRCPFGSMVVIWR